MKNPDDDADFEEIEHLWIPMPDGVRLSARLWLPRQGPCPALLEYIPYRKRDLVRARDERNHPFFAANGYACLRVDMRGSGDSEGVMPDMYDPNELEDARHVINWIAQQPWCTGRVGMFGTSWGGTASLQAAVDAPEPLKAVIANCATIDRFEDDIHWMGGLPLTDSFEWGVTLPAILAAPPDAATVGDGWHDMWMARLGALTHPLQNWLAHKTRGDYWRHGSVRFQADRLTCPVLTIGGWADRYSNSVMRLVSARPDLAWGIVGPWGHHYPDHGEPGPAMSFQETALHWWNHWLKRDDPGELAWPKLRLWQRRFDPPQNRVEDRTGQWMEASTVTTAAQLSLSLGDGFAMSDAASLEIPSDPAHGQMAGDTGYFGRVGGMPLNQSSDDARGLCFETGPLDTAIDLWGHAGLTLSIQGKTENAQIAVRICDVAPDGTSNLVTRTVRNLGLTQSLDARNANDKDKPNAFQIELPTMVYRFQAGHRLRLVLAQSYWPLVWPSEGTDDLKVVADTLRLDLPQPPTDASTMAAPLPAPGGLPDTPTWEPVSSGALTRNEARLGDQSFDMGWHQPLDGMRFPEVGIGISTETEADYHIPQTSPGPASCQFGHRILITRPDGTAEVLSKLSASGSAGSITVDASLQVTWNGEQTFQRSWHYTV